MKPSNFPARKNRRRQSAIKRLDLSPPAHPIAKLEGDTLALRLTSDVTARAVRTKKDRRAFAKVRQS